MNEFSCDCKDYKIGMVWIIQCESLAIEHSWKYEGMVMKYCPWCGKKLKESLEEKEENKTIPLPHIFGVGEKVVIKSKDIKPFSIFDVYKIISIGNDYAMISGETIVSYFTDKPIRAKRKFIVSLSELIPVKQLGV